MLIEKHTWIYLKYNTMLQILQSQNYKNGCYNILCPGFVQTNRAYYLGSRIANTSSTVDLTKVEMPISLLQVISLLQI
jgi:hypothetical protein